MRSIYSVYSVQMYEVDCLTHSVPVSALEPYTSSRFIVTLSPIYPHVSQVVDYDHSFRLKLLGTACTSSAYPTQFNYKSFLQVIYCVNICHTRSFFSTLLFTLTHYISFLCAVFYFSIIFLNFELRLSVWKVLRIAFCAENWHCYGNKATVNGAIKVTNNVL
jgi:hypothetical protein